MSNDFTGRGIPANYNYVNMATAAVSPSTVHGESGLTAFFVRYLLQKAMSVFRYTLPENWDKTYFLYTLYSIGYIAVVNTDKFGTICQSCGLTGYDVYYRPTHAVIANPLLTGILQPRIGAQCELIKLTPDYGGIMDLVYYYADMMAICASTAGLNVLNSKLSYVFTAKNKAGAESFKKLYDRIASGEPAVVQDKSLLNDDGTFAWDTFTQNVGQNFIAPQVLETLAGLENRFATAVGLPNANTQKRERMLTDEVNANNVETYSNASMWLETIQECCDRVNTRFYSGNRALWCEWRVNPNTEETEVDNAD